jgi:hypothetical protein
MYVHVWKHYAHIWPSTLLCSSIWDVISHTLFSCMRLANTLCAFPFTNRYKTCTLPQEKKILDFILDLWVKASKHYNILSSKVYIYLYFYNSFLCTNRKLLYLCRCLIHAWSSFDFHCVGNGSWPYWEEAGYHSWNFLCVSISFLYLYIIKIKLFIS